MSNPLMHELAIHEYLREQLTERFPEADEETLSDTMEGLTSLHEKLGAVIRSQLEDRTLSKALRARIEEMQERSRRLEYRVEQKRDLVTTVMERAQIKKIVEPDFSVHMRQGPRPLVISDEAVIQEEYWRPQPPKLDRKKLIDDLKNGASLAGACLGNGSPNISVRTG